MIRFLPISRSHWIVKIIESLITSIIFHDNAMLLQYNHAKSLIATICLDGNKAGKENGSFVKNHVFSYRYRRKDAVKRVEAVTIQFVVPNDWKDNSTCP